MLRTLCVAAGLAATLAGGLAPADAQTLNVMRGVDAPSYDGQRTTWSPAADIINMVQDTLVAMDWDGRTPIPYLAKSWEVSEDGRTYTFHLRDDVTFCSGKKMTAEDVAYTFKRLKDPATKAPFGWRAGPIKEVRASDPYTVVYELEEPFSELLLQLTMFTNVIINKDSVEKLGADYGTKGLDGTGPWCFVSWTPRTEVQLKRHDAYRWGPSMYQNKGPVKFERMQIKFIPEESTRVAAMLAGQFDVTTAFPLAFLDQARASPRLKVEKAEPNFQLHYFGFKITRDLVADKRVRHAMAIAINRAEIAQAVMFGSVPPEYTLVDPRAIDYAPKTGEMIKEDVEHAKRLLEEAGWKVGSDGIREKDGVKLAPRVIYSVATNAAKTADAIQGYMRKIGVDWRLNPLDSTIAPIKLAEQDYEIWTLPVPYMSAGDLLNVYFDSKNVPTPNRMNWKDADTDKWLAEGRSALTEKARAEAYAKVQERVSSEYLLVPVFNQEMYQVSNKALKGTRAHMLYQNTFYKGLDMEK